MARKKATRQEVADLATQYVTNREAGREAYTQADQAYEKLLEHFGGPGEYKLLDGRVVVISDPFVDGNGRLKKVWKNAGVKRFDVQVRNPAAN